MATPTCVPPASTGLHLGSKVVVTLSAVYNGQELNLDLTPPTLEVYSYAAFKSKASFKLPLR